MIASITTLVIVELMLLFFIVDSSGESVRIENRQIKDRPIRWAVVEEVQDFLCVVGPEAVLMGYLGTRLERTGGPGSFFFFPLDDLER